MVKNDQEHVWLFLMNQSDSIYWQTEVCKNFLGLIKLFTQFTYYYSLGVFPLLKWKLFPTCIQNLPARSRCTDSSDGLRKWFSHFEEPLGHRRAIFHRVTHQLDRRKFHLRKDLTWPASEWQNWTWPHHFIIISEKTGFLNDEIQSYECRSLKVPVPD